MPTIGLTSKGSYSFVEAANVIALSRVTMPSGGGTGNTLYCYCQENGSAGHVKLLVYDDDGSSGNAGTRLFVSAALTLSTSEGWISVSLSNLSLPAGNYWIGFVADVQIRSWVNQGTGNFIENKNISNGYASPPATYPAPQYTDTATLSAYIDYAAAPSFIPMIFEY